MPNLSQLDRKDCYQSPGKGMSATSRLAIRATHVMIEVIGAVAKVVGRQRMEKPIAWLEHLAKGPLFDCQECGNCMLNQTALRCPTRCKKELRNGPCGGVRQDGTCEVDATMVCAWRDIWLHNGGLLPDRLPPREFNFAGRSAWIAEAFEGMPKAVAIPPKRNDLPVSRLQQEFESGRFVLTGEAAPGATSDPASLLHQAELLTPMVTAINVTDAAGGNPALSSMASCAILAAHGHNPVVQLTCRDRNRIGLQSDLLAASALGIENILCLTGDDVCNGDHPGARRVFDLDSISLLATASVLRDGGTFLSGRALTSSPTYYIGGVENPFAPPQASRVQRLGKKIDAGAQFIMTQIVYDVDSFELFMQEVVRQGWHKRAHILAGVGLLASAKAAHFMNDQVPGMRIPASILKQLDSAPKALDVGIPLAVDTLRRMRAMEGLAGAHLMFHHAHINKIAPILAQAGLDTPEARRQKSAAKPRQAVAVSS